MTNHPHRILILDFGSQYTQLIARRIREMGVYCEIRAFSASNEDINAFQPSGIILSGGPESVTINQSPRAPEVIFALGCPILGICYGMQTMALQLGGQVIPGEKREFGYAEVSLLAESKLLGKIHDKILSSLNALDVWMSHGDQVSEVPPQFSTIANSSNCSIVIMEDQKRNFFGLQFHPEVSHTRQGQKILERFVLEICACKPTWTPINIIDAQIDKIRQLVGKDKVLLGLSGGVDSSVAAVLLHKAIGEQLYCVFVDTGLLRLNEAEEIKTVFANHFGINLITVDAKKEFYTAIDNVDDPETKRKIIGKTFIDVFDAQAKQIQNVKWLAQGTIYSDVIESAAAQISGAHLIKSHHNVGGLPEKMHLQLLEPLRELFKDEVRKLGLALGLTKEIVYRHPFPGPGLGIRVLGAIKPEYIHKLRLADAILIEELFKFDLYYKVSQAFAVFLPVKSVGVIGDARHYDHVIAIRIVQTTDFMTAHWAQVPYEFLESISSRIINEVPGISRVTYDISSKPPATIEWE